MSHTTKKERALEMVSYWATCESMGLANHFHGITGLGTKEPTSIISRVKKLYLNPKDLKILMDVGGDEEEPLMLFMALSVGTSQEFLSFQPLLHLTKQDVYLSFSEDVPGPQDGEAGQYANEKNFGASPVPLPFVQSISRNWLLLDPASIDDVFLARMDKQQYEAPRLERLRGFYMSKNHNSILFRAIKMAVEEGLLRYIAFHLGTDMNKADMRGEFTFSPVVELKVNDLRAIDSVLTDFQLSQPLQSKESLPAKVIEEDGSGSLYFEYLHPCPSTCPPDPDDPSEI